MRFKVYILYDHGGNAKRLGRGSEGYSDDKQLLG